MAQASYEKFTKNLYLSDEIFGLAEGLAINNTSIFLILDNNGDPLRSDVTKKNPVLLEFKRPKGF